MPSRIINTNFKKRDTTWKKKEIKKATSNKIGGQNQNCPPSGDSK